MVPWWISILGNAQSEAAAMNNSAMALELLYHIYALEDLGIWYCLVL